MVNILLAFAAGVIVRHYWTPVVDFIKDNVKE